MTTSKCKIKYNEETGERCVKAVEEIPALDIVFQESALLLCPRDLTEGCLVCGVETSSQCSGCSYLLCHDQCELQHGARECQLLQRHEGQLASEVLLILRMIETKNNCLEKWNIIDTMKDHVEERKQDIKEWSRVQQEVVAVVKNLVEDDIDDKLIQKMFGILQINCVLTEDLIGLYPTMARVNHDCVANSVHNVTPDNQLVVRAKRMIPSDEEVTVSYVSVWCGQPHRRRQLARKWFFDCSCPRCCDVTEFGSNMSALRCNSCNQGLILPTSNKIGNDWSCRFCDNPMAETAVISVVDNIEQELVNLLKSDPDVSNLKKFISKYSHQLHRKHYILLLAQRHIITFLAEKKALSREDAMKIIQLAKSIKMSLSPVDTGYSDWLGYILKMINMSQLQLLKLNLQEKKINKNVFAEESELIWAAMQEVKYCEILNSDL